MLYLADSIIFKGGYDMSFTNQTTHYGLPQWIGSDKPTYLVDQNNAYQTIDSEIYNANVAAGEAVTTANGASSTAGAASATAADALSAAQTASTTADNALTEAQTANTNAQTAQTAAGAAQTAAQAAQEAAAGNSITNLAPAYDSTITYAVDDLVTQDGKLYKCIVAVVTPEQFDVNKWDDVTTSEVYLRQASVETRLKKVGMNDNSNFTFSNTNDYIVLESRADNGKVRALLYDVQNNLFKLRKSDNNGITFLDSQLFPTMRIGQSLTIKTGCFALLTSNDGVMLVIQNPRFQHDNAANYSLTVNEAAIRPYAGEASSTTINISNNMTSASILAIRDDELAITIHSADVPTANIPLNGITYSYIDITVTRNS